MTLAIPRQVSLIGLFLFLVLICVPVVDNITGTLFKLKLMQEGAIGSPSQLARFAMFILVLWLLNEAKQASIIKPLLIATCSLFTVEVVLAFFHLNFKAFLYGIVFSIKILFSLGCFLYISDWIAKDRKKTVYMIKQLIVYGTVVAILVLAAYASGFHISNYELGIATRGLFISGNGLGIVLGVSLLLFVHYTPKFTFLKFLHLAILFSATALLGTKAGMLFVAVTLLVAAVRFAKHSPVFTILLLTAFSIYLLVPLIELLALIFENIIFKFNNIDNKFHFIASSRDKFITDAFKQIKLEDFYSLRVLFGGGAYYSYTDFAQGTAILRKSLENDLFELFFCYGIFWATIYVALYGYAMRSLLKVKNIFLCLPLSLAFFHSITMGHVLFNGTSAITYALCLAIATNGNSVTRNDF